MNVFDPHAAQHRALEDRLGAIERDIAVIKTTLEHLDKRIPSPWLIVTLVLPLYGVVIFGMAGLFFALASLLRAAPAPIS